MLKIEREQKTPLIVKESKQAKLPKAATGKKVLESPLRHDGRARIWRRHDRNIPLRLCEAAAGFHNEDTQYVRTGRILIVHCI